MEQIEQKYINEKQVSALTGISVATLQNHRFYRVGLPYIKLDRSVRYSLEEVHRYMQAHAINPDNSLMK